MKNGNSLIGKSFLRNAYFGYGAQGLKIALGFAWVTTLTTVAGFQVYGMIALLTSLSGFIGNLVTFRTNEGVVKFYKRGVVEDDVGLCKLAILAGLVLDIAVALVLFTIVRGFADLIATNLLKDPEVAAAVISYSWVIFANFMRGTGIGLLTANEGFRMIYSLSVVEQLVRLILFWVMWNVQGEVSVDTVVWVILFPAMVTTIFVIAMPLTKLYSLPREVKIATSELRNYFIFTLSTFTSSGLKAGNRGIDNLILGFLTNPESVGIYNLFKRFLSPLSVVVTPFYTQIYPKFVEAMSRGDSDRIRYTVVRTNKDILKWSLLLLLAITAAVVMYWSYMEFHFSFRNVLTFSIVAVTSLIFQQLWWTRAFALSHNPNISIWANLIKSFLVVSLGYVLTLRFGMVGTAIGMLATSACMCAFWYSALSKYSKEKGISQ